MSIWPVGQPRVLPMLIDSDDAIRAYNAESKQARTWPIQFLIRRTAHHVLDHPWEMEDRDPPAQAMASGGAAW
jgi:hypothetical protein